MDLETLKNDLIGNSKKYDRLVAQRNNLNVEIIMMDGVIGYIKEVISAEEQKAKILAADKKKEEQKAVKKPA